MHSEQGQALSLQLKNWMGKAACSASMREDFQSIGFGFASIYVRQQAK